MSCKERRKTTSTRRSFNCWGKCSLCEQALIPSIFYHTLKLTQFPCSTIKNSWSETNLLSSQNPEIYFESIFEPSGCVLTVLQVAESVKILERLRNNSMSMVCFNDRSLTVVAAAASATFAEYLNRINPIAADHCLIHMKCRRANLFTQRIIHAQHS